MPIRLLSETLAAQIAAGEVVERPASVVKELIENSLDAGATRIEIEIGGLTAIRVADDGTGIPTQEVELALQRHATSKISTFDDLIHVQTLGFRGEALASIASVSQLTLTTRHRDEKVGTQIVVNGGKLIHKEPFGAPNGTTIEVQNLFYNVPARRKFLKSDTTESRHVNELVMRYAMAYPQVRFALYTDGRETFRTTGQGTLGDVIVDVLGIEMFRHMVEIVPLERLRPDLAPIRVYGFSSRPGQTRANRSQIMLFINGRSISDSRLTYAVVQAYHTLIPHNRYPISVLMIEMPSEEVDVNVHPTKAEVRFRTPDAVFSAVQRTVRQALMNQHDVTQVETANFGGWDAPNFPSSEARPQYPEQLGMAIPDTGRHTRQIPSQHRWDDTDDAFVRDIPVGMDAPARPRKLPLMRVVGQIAATYIVAEGPAGMYLVDQHAAHERIMYEELMRQFHAQDKLVQHTLEATIVQLAPMNARRLEQHLDVLNHIGFVISPFGKDAFRVEAVPAPLADHNPEEVLNRLLQDLESGKSPGEETIEQKIVKKVCKTASVKAGQVLSYDEMVGLLRQLERCDTPLTCPHGRPTMIHLSASDLAKEFGRT